MIAKLVALVPKGWSLSRLKYNLPPGGATLLAMRVEAHEPPVELSAKRKGKGSLQQEESFFMWMRMPQGSARRHGQSQADMCALHPISDIAASGPPNDEHDQARADSDGDDDEVDGVGDLLDIASAGLSGDGTPDLDLQAELLEVLEADMQANDIEDGEDEDVEDEDGNEPQAASSSVVEEPATAACHEAVVDQAVAAAEEEEAHPPGTEFGLDGQLSLSAAGYVRVASQPFNGKVIGLVGVYSDRRTMFANCHLHPHCAIKCGVVLCPVSRMKLAEWLATGEPSEGLAMEDRRRLGKEHRAKWSRDGPLG